MLGEVRIPNVRELRQRTVLVRRLIGRVGEEIEIPILVAEGAVRAGSVEYVKSAIEEKKTKK